jgi:hypothetical protein
MRFSSVYLFSPIVVGLVALSQPALAQSVTLTAPNAIYRIDTATLSVAATINGDPEIKLAEPAYEAGAVTMGSNNGWHVVAGAAQYDVQASLDGAALVIAITAKGPAQLAWPRGTGDGVNAYALPIFGEGRYIPADDAQWIAFLANGYDSAALTETLSMPMWTELRADASLTWIVETPFDTKLSLKDAAGRLSVGLEHDFTDLEPSAEYRVRIEAGIPDPVIGALQYRQFLQASGQYKSLDDKIAENPNVALLAGAPHIYLWDKGPLKAADVTTWRRLVRQFGAARGTAGTLSAKLWAGFDDEAKGEVETAINEAQGDDGFVSKYSQSVIIRAINAALPSAVARPTMTPLEGGHDPAGEVAWIADVRAALAAEFPGSLAPAAEWGSGISTTVVKALKGAGIEAAWLGSENWDDALWHPEAVVAAKDAGFLVGIYDSYASAHQPDAPQTWPTAQMGKAIADSAGYKDATGKPITGFGGGGVYVNPLAVVDYAHQRISAVANAAGLDSYFLDVDATGLVWSDHTPGRLTSEAQTAAVQQARLAYSSKTLGLVTGSEGGMAIYAKDIAFAHGMTTPPFAWMDPDIGRNKASKFYRGNYWPPEAPTLFFKPTPIPDDLRRVLFAPEFKLPLYEIALHDSIITTHHWEFSSLKVAGERDRTALLQMLYMIPPLYHLSASVLDADLPYIGAYLKAFSPEHRRLFDKAMTGFTFLSDDRLLQRTSFSDGSVITANFADTARQVDAASIPPQAADIAGPDGRHRIVDMTGLD